MKIFIVMPVYNDNKRSVETVNGILRFSDRQVVVVNDGSTDSTMELLKKNFSKNEKVTLMNHEVNYGKGAAMRTGAEESWRQGAQAVIFIDADGQHDPRMLIEFEKSLKTNEIVFGYREIDNKMPFMRRLFNILTLRLIRLMFGIKKRDLFCGFLGFKRKVYGKILWSSNRYGIETEMAAKVGRRQIPFKEIKIETIYLGKKHGISLWDAILILLKLPIWYFEV